jgi:hypothetical protein
MRLADFFLLLKGCSDAGADVHSMGSILPAVLRYRPASPGFSASLS